LSHGRHIHGYEGSVQTFLPYPGFLRSAQALDQRRLGKQRVETLQVLRGLTRPRYGWRHHPAVKMWAGYEEALVRYGLTVCAVWSATGLADTCAVTLGVDLATACGITHVRPQEELAVAGELPPWLGDEPLHRSHRASLLRKDPAFYGPLFGEEPSDIPYVWPASDREPGCRAAASP
jgi:Pyrimidine dimer DNA glycosylase